MLEKESKLFTKEFFVSSVFFTSHKYFLGYNIHDTLQNGEGSEGLAVIQPEAIVHLEKNHAFVWGSTLFCLFPAFIFNEYGKMFFYSK